MTVPRFEQARVSLLGVDGNAFGIIGKASRALNDAGVEQTDIDAFRKEAMSGDYDNVLATVFRWMHVD